jgi:NitT/TauT family transport system substrate-binding protein
MQLTLTGKIVAALVILSAAASAGVVLWKKSASNPTGSEPTAASEQRSTANTPPGPVATQGIGSESNPLKVSLVSFHGYAPGILANGSNLQTQPNSLYAKAGVNIKFLIQDDIPTLSDLFEKGTAHCAWRTSDFWAQEHPNLRNNKMDASAVMVVDNTQGGDAIITRDPSINSVEDLAGRRIGLLQFTPSHGMTVDAIQNSSLSARKKDSIKYVFVDAAEGTGGVRAMLESGNVDAIALWDPDLALALRLPGAKVVYSTKTATNLIYDVMVCDKRVLNNPEGVAAVGKFVAGWMDGVDAARANPDAAVQALVNTQDAFKQLAQKEGPDFIKGLFANVVWTNLTDNVRVLGLGGGTNHYERVYTQFDQIYRAAGALANPNSPVIPAQQSFDYRFIQQLVDSKKVNVQAAAQKNQPSFSQQELNTVAKSENKSVTKPVQVSFASGSSELTQRAKQTIDKEMVPLIENNGSAYFEISGNTDSVGSDAVNVPLSQSRARAVRDYLVSQWEFNGARFKVVGNGASKPICNEANPGAEGLDEEACRAVNRSTRIAVYR